MADTVKRNLATPEGAEATLLPVVLEVDGHARFTAMPPVAWLAEVPEDVEDVRPEEAEDVRPAEVADDEPDIPVPDA